MLVMLSATGLLDQHAAALSMLQETTDKTTPLGVNLLKSQVLFSAAQIVNAAPFCACTYGAVRWHGRNAVWKVVRL